MDLLFLSPAEKDGHFLPCFFFSPFRRREGPPLFFLLFSSNCDFGGERCLLRAVFPWRGDRHRPFPSLLPPPGNVVNFSPISFPLPFQQFGRGSSSPFFRFFPPSIPKDKEFQVPKLGKSSAGSFFPSSVGNPSFPPILLRDMYIY